MRFKLSDKARAAVANTSPRQTWAFVMSSRSHDAVVVNATIAFDTAKREARAIGGVMRVGHVQDGEAETC